MDNKADQAHRALDYLIEEVEKMQFTGTTALLIDTHNGTLRNIRSRVEVVDKNLVEKIS